MNNSHQADRLPYRNLIISLSVVIPIAVALLFNVRIEGYDFTFLPPIYASLNALTSICLVAAVMFIKRKNIQAHRVLMTAALLFSALFLVLYVMYHATSTSTPYGGEGLMRGVYFFILISHIILSIGVIPLVLITYVRAMGRQFDKHKKIARITFPIWLYVAVTGVLVYIMISPYYS